MRLPLLAAMSLASLLTSGYPTYSADGSVCVGIASDLERLKCYDAVFSHGIAETNDDAVRFCKELTISNLRSPSSFVLIRTTVEKSDVVIEYDAQNGFGAVVREINACRFAFDGSEFIYLNSSFNNGNHLDRRFTIDPAKTSLSKEDGKKLFEYETRPSEAEANDLLSEICMQKFSVSYGVTASVIKDSIGSVTVYLKTSDGNPFKIAQCTFSGSEMKSHGVIN